MTPLESFLQLGLIFALVWDVTTGAQFAYMHADEYGTLKVSPMKLKESPPLAQASFTDKIQEEGFSYLTVTTDAEYQDADQAYSAGYLEAFLTKHLINMTFYNNGMESLTLSDDVKEFLTKNYNYLESNTETKKDESYWYQVWLLLHQIKGLEDGFLGKPEKVSADIDPLGLFWTFNWKSGELWDVEQKFMYGVQVFGSGSCSALIKNLGHDIVVSHATWGDYNWLLRVVKKYELPYRVSQAFEGTVPGSTVLETSYPGVIHSIDDFYITNQNLVITETTNEIFNRSLFANIEAQGSVPYFIRIVVANKLSNSGQSWVNFFSKFNSGTYNNQWMVVDYKKFTQFLEVDAGTLWVLEQMPGFVVSKDMSRALQTGNKAWTSYNLPYFQKVQKLDNITAQINEYGLFFSHDSCPRANIFNRDLHTVVDVNTTIQLMRYNDFQNDPYAKSNCTPLGYSAENGISARCDLNPINSTCKIASEGPRCHGATDLKVVNMQMVADMHMVAISGPTHEQQPVFDWGEQEDTACRNYRHQGHPKRFEFSPVLVTI